MIYIKTKNHAGQLTYSSMCFQQKSIHPIRTQLTLISMGKMGGGDPHHLPENRDFSRNEDPNIQTSL